MKSALCYFFAVGIFSIAIAASADLDTHQDATDIKMKKTYLMKIGQCKNAKPATPQPYTPGPNVCPADLILVGITYKIDGTPEAILCGSADQCIGPGDQVTIP